MDKRCLYPAFDNAWLDTYAAYEDFDRVRSQNNADIAMAALNDLFDELLQIPLSPTGLHAEYEYLYTALHTNILYIERQRTTNASSPKYA